MRLRNKSNDLQFVSSESMESHSGSPCRPKFIVLVYEINLDVECNNGEQIVKASASGLLSLRRGSVARRKKYTLKIHSIKQFKY